MRALSFAFLLALQAASPAAALEAEIGLRAQKLREAIDSLPAPARVELKKMYQRYKKTVARRLEMGWQTGVLSKAVIENIDEPYQPARLIEEKLDLRREEAARIQEALRQVASDDPYNTKRLRRALEDKREEVRILESRNNREKGLCRDWSDQIWAEFMAMELEHWAPRDQRRATRPYHTAAVICSTDSPTVCLVFDPWKDGRLNVYAYGAWDESEPGGRFPAEYFIHELPDKVESK